MIGWRLIVPEFERIPTKREFAAGIETAQVRDLVLRVLIVCALIIFAAWMLMSAGGGLVSSVGVVGAIFAAIVVAQVIRGAWSARPIARAYLNSIGLPTCVACGHDARGVHLSRCPECGADLSNQTFLGEKQRFRLPGRREAAWRAAVALGALRSQNYEALNLAGPQVQIVDLTSRTGAAWSVITSTVPAHDQHGGLIFCRAEVRDKASDQLLSHQLAWAEGLVPEVPRG